MSRSADAGLQPLPAADRPARPQQREMHGETALVLLLRLLPRLPGARMAIARSPRPPRWLIRLGVGGFLAMNVMLFSLLSMPGAFSGEDAWLRQPVALALLGCWRRRWWPLLGAPFFEQRLAGLARGPPATDTLVCIGVLARLRLFDLAGAARLGPRLLRYRRHGAAAVHARPLPGGAGRACARRAASRRCWRGRAGRSARRASTACTAARCAA